MASPEKQRELFMTYCSFLNSLPIGATAKITLFNRQLNQKDFGRTLLMPMQGDRRDLYRNEYNALVLGKAAENVPSMLNYQTLIETASMYNTPPCWCIYMTGPTHK